MNHGTILGHCVGVLDTYNKEMQSVEEHVNKYLKLQAVRDESEQTFIVEVFSGCVRYCDILDVVLEAFYAKDGKNVLKSERNLYAVLAYLALFRLDELGMAHYRQFVRSQDLNRMYRFLSFFFDEDSLMSWMKDAWMRHYEHVFVQTKLISPLRRWIPELQEMVQQMRDKIENKTKPKRKVQNVTETRPFNITQPRPKSVPVPEPIPKLTKHKAPPETLYREPSEFKKIDVVRQTNRRKAEERLMDASRKQFACANPEKSQKTKTKLHNIIQEEENKLDFDRMKTNPVPSFLVTPGTSRTGSARRRTNQDVPVKMTAAAILREGHLYQKREYDEIKRLENLEAGAKDKSEFEKWQSEMKQKDLESQLADIERRRLEGKLSHEEAILARQNLIKENRQRVAEIKEETKRMMDEFLEKKFKEEQLMKNLVEDTMQGHKNAKEAKKKLKEYKQKIVQEVAEESKELMRIALEEAEIEMRRRMELIHQIRAMEAVPVIRQKFVDFTETSGAGLLSEMSIAEEAMRKDFRMLCTSFSLEPVTRTSVFGIPGELLAVRLGLKERLSLLRTAEKEREESKRDEILASKEAKDQILLDTLETISKHRLEQTKANANRLEERKKGELPKKMEVKTEELTALQKRLEEKKRQRLQEQAAQRTGMSADSAQRTRSLINQKKRLEENRWKELESTRERNAGMLQGYSKSASRLANPITAS